MKFKQIQLGDVCTISSSKRIFAREYKEHGVPFYRGKEIIEKHNGTNLSNELYISKERYNEIKERYGVPQINDILLTSVGTLGVSWLVDEEEFYFKDGNLTWLHPNEEINNVFLYWWLNSPEAKNQIDIKCIGSTQKALTIETLNKFNVSLPPLTIQERICGVLQSLQEKISNNAAINKNLEEQAHAIFDSFYEQSEREVPFTSIIQIFGGGTPKTKEESYWNGDIPFFTPKDVGSPYTLSTEKTITSTGLENCNSRLYPVNTTFVTARGTVGKVSLAGVPMAMNQSCYALAGDNIHPILTYFYTLKTVQSLQHKASGAVFDAIVTSDFKTETINKLSNDVELKVLEIIEPMMESILQNSMENVQLVTLRDTLLPRLMSGEINVLNIES